MAGNGGTAQISCRPLANGERGCNGGSNAIELARDTFAGIGCIYVFVFEYRGLFPAHARPRPEGREVGAGPLVGYRGAPGDRDPDDVE